MKKTGKANQTIKNIVKGNNYLIESTGIGTVDVYDLNGDFINTVRLDYFENIKNIE